MYWHRASQLLGSNYLAANANLPGVSCAQEVPSECVDEEEEFDKYSSWSSVTMASIRRRLSQVLSTLQVRLQHMRPELAANSATQSLKFTVSSLSSTHGCAAQHSVWHRIAATASSPS